MDVKIVLEEKDVMLARTPQRVEFFLLGATQMLVQ
jgi:hypothetical protein